MPPLWTGLSDLVASMVERNPTEALTIASVAAAQAAPEASVALKSLWEAPSEAAGAHSRYAVRTLDASGRLSLSIACEGVANLPARRAGSVLTVYLPGSVSKSTGRTSASVPLRGGRLTLTKALRAQLGIAERADVLVVHDQAAATLTVTAASRLDTLVANTLAALANGTHHPFADECSADGDSPADNQKADKGRSHLQPVADDTHHCTPTGERR